MRKQNVTLLVMATIILSSHLACGPKCPEVKSAMSESELTDDDATRVNEFVTRRKALMEEAREGEKSSFELERLKFSVTAYEMAIQLQLRIIELASTSELYEANIDEITDTRCLLDEVLEEKVVKKDDYSITDGVGKEIQQKHALFRKLFGKDGEVSGYELKQYFEKGIKVKKKPDGEDNDEDEDEDETEDDEDDEDSEDFF